LQREGASSHAAEGTVNVLAARMQFFLDGQRAGAI
jgi:hypothetical protein